MEKIRPIYIQEFQQFLVQECFITNKEGKIRSLSNNYIKQIFSKSRIIFKRAMVLEVIDENPMDTIGKIRTQRSAVASWTVDEFKKVYNCSYRCDFQEAFYKRMIRFLFVTRLRSEEFLALQWPDIDFHKGTCCVSKSLYIRTRTDYDLSDIKNASSIRTITLDKQTIVDLREWKETQRTIGDDLGFIFTFDGLPPSPKTFLGRVKRLAEIAGVKPVHLHGLRHSHIAFSIEHNNNIHTVSKHLGCSSVRTALDKYSHLYPNTNQTLADEFIKFEV